MKKYGWWILVLLLLASMVWYVYQGLLGHNVQLKEDSRLIFIPTGADYEQVKDSLAPYLVDLTSFELVAEKKQYPQQIEPGRYRIEQGMSNVALVDLLRAGDQEELDLVVRPAQSKEALAGKVAAQLEQDSAAFLAFFRNLDTLESMGIAPQAFFAQIIPNTYSFYWNSSPGFFMQRMQAETARFFEARASALERLAMTPEEVMTLASIVAAETARDDEMAKVAGLYLNRLKRGIKLQSDPTVIYALEKDQPGLDIKRVLFRHLKYRSPYNTYLNKGLPPGPIRIPPYKAIEAVLSPEKHDFIFMAADPKRPGYHSFARNLREHGENRREYIRWLEAQGG